MRNLRQKPTISHKKPAPGASKWDARLLERTKMAADKKLTRELQEAKEADRERVKQINLERKRKQEEKARMLAAAEKARLFSWFL
jgi:hypothetical protein